MRSVYTQIGVPFFSVRLGALEIRVNRGAHALCLHVKRCPLLLGTSQGPLIMCKSRCPCALFTRKSVPPPSRASRDPYLRVNGNALAFGLHVNQCFQVRIYAWKDTYPNTFGGL